jgi:hypothetical protein
MTGANVSETLRPSTLGEILDRTFQLYRSNFWRFVGVGALPMLVALLLAVPVGAIFALLGIAVAARADSVTVIRAVTFAVAYIIFVPVYLGAFALSIAGITEGTMVAQRGETFIIRGVLKTAWPRFWTYCWYLLLQAIVTGFAPVCAAGVFIAPLVYLIMRPGAGIGAGVALVFLLVVLVSALAGVIIWLFLSFAMGMAACVVEKKTAWESLKRSWQLSPGTRGRIFVLYLLVTTLMGVVVMMSYFLAFVFIALASLAGNNKVILAIAAVIGLMIYLIGVFGTPIALLPLPWIALTLFYFDQRIRKEGFDIEWMMQQAGLAPAGSNSPPSPAVAGFPPVQPPDTLGER